jgi:hypothetical protein
MKQVTVFFIWCLWAQAVSAQTKLTAAQMREMYDGMVPEIGRSTLAYRVAVTQKILGEANFFASRLKLPTPHPIQITDIRQFEVSSPWSSVIHETNELHYPISSFGSNIYNSNIPRDARLRALEIGANGSIETSNFVFYFDRGKIREVMRITQHNLERYARDLDQLVGKPSLINEAQAHELATEWLAAVDVETAALAKEKWAVHQLRYLAEGATDAVTLPLYYVDFGSIHYTNGPENHKEFDEPRVHVEILGTTKELQDITINDGPLLRRPLLLITNALDLVRMHDPPAKQFNQPSSIVTTNSTSL